MTKEAYMSQLKTALQKCTPEFRSDILADYEEFFRCGLAVGKTEEEICMQLGNIEDFVREIPTECYVHDDTSVDTSPESFVQNHTLPAETTSETDGYSTVKLKIHTCSSDIQIYPGDTDGIKIDAEGRYDIRYEGNECTITLPPVGSRNFMGIFSIQSGDSAAIYIPHTVRYLDICSSSSDIEIENLQLEELKCRISSGDQTMSNISAKVLSAASASGDIDMENSHIDNLTLQSSSGDISCLNIKAGTLKASSSSGDIEISNHVTCSASLNSVSGDILYDDKTGQGYQININTRSGDYSLNFRSRELACGSGRNTFSCGNGSSVLEISTVSGDIEING